MYFCYSSFEFSQNLINSFSREIELEIKKYKNPIVTPTNKNIKTRENGMKKAFINEDFLSFIFHAVIMVINQTFSSLSFVGNANRLHFVFGLLLEHTFEVW